MAIELVIAHPDTEQETHYQLIGSLGEGGSGTTYQAQIVGTKRSVALKQLSLKQMDDWKTIELFEREAKILSQLNHPGIPAYIDYFTSDTPTDRHFYIAQALAHGKTLSDWIESGVSYSEAEIKDIARQILEILSYVHTLTPPVVHGDINPSNILRTADGQISLVDFGAVRQVYHDTLLGGSTVVGTFGYMAPEQFRAQAFPATDLYGLGATILTLFINHSPVEFTYYNLKISFREKILVSPVFADWLEQMLEPDLADRFESATTALSVLKNPKSIVSKLSWRKLTAIGVAAVLAALKNPKSIVLKLPWRKITVIGVAAVIGLGTLNYYKYYFLNLWGLAPVEAFTAIWQNQDVDRVKSLLDRGVNPNAKDNNGITLIHYAVTNNQIDIAKLLIDRGADIHAHYAKDGHTVLHLAVLHKNGVMTGLLLKNRADPDSKDNYNYTSLHVAVLRAGIYNYQEYYRRYYGMSSVSDRDNSIESIKYLIASGANVNAIGGVIDNRPPTSDLDYLDYGTPLHFTHIRARNESRQYYSAEDIRFLLRKYNAKYSRCDLKTKECTLADTYMGQQ